jgi:hypothetical protein
LIKEDVREVRGWALAIYLDGGDAPDLAEDGTPLFDDDLLVLVKGW